MTEYLSEFTRCKRHPPPFLNQRRQQLEEKKDNFLLKLSFPIHVLAYYGYDEILDSIQSILQFTQFQELVKVDILEYRGQCGNILTIWEASNKDQTVRWIHSEGWEMGADHDMLFLFFSESWWKAPVHSLLAESTSSDSSDYSNVSGYDSDYEDEEFDEAFEA